MKLVVIDNDGDDFCAVTDIEEYFAMLATDQTVVGKAVFAALSRAVGIEEEAKTEGERFSVSVGRNIEAYDDEVQP